MSFCCAYLPVLDEAYWDVWNERRPAPTRWRTVVIPIETMAQKSETPSAGHQCSHVRGRQGGECRVPEPPAQASREIHAHAQTFVGFFLRVLSPTLFYSIHYSALSTREQANLTTQRAGRVGAGVRRRGHAAGRSAAYTEGYRAVCGDVNLEGKKVGNDEAARDVAFFEGGWIAYGRI